ncbi:MAG: MBL fold metallo-hydrolase [Bacteroidales bacterium]|jgi:hydroxyacylglutathione hydrolase|nr:MBL fold metallo-hydrolase [Bacteroidales bacterium]
MSDILIKRIQYANAAGFLVVKGDSSILIDTGHSTTVEKFQKLIKKAGVSPESISLIILTHTHFDHAGGASQIQKLTGASLAVHRSEADFLFKGRTSFPRGTRWKGKLMVVVGSLLARRMANYPPVNADILIDDELDLNPYGIPGIVIHTPGHTAGSVSVLLENGNAFVGDNVLGVSLKEYFPPFANDKRGVLESWERYIEEGVVTLYPAHGRKVSIDKLKEELAAAKRKYL